MRRPWGSSEMPRRMRKLVRPQKAAGRASELSGRRLPPAHLTMTRFGQEFRRHRRPIELSHRRACEQRAEWTQSFLARCRPLVITSRQIGRFAKPPRPTEMRRPSQTWGGCGPGLLLSADVVGNYGGSRRAQIMSTGAAFWFGRQIAKGTTDGNGPAGGNRTGCNDSNGIRGRSSRPERTRPAHSPRVPPSPRELGRCN